MKSTDIIKELMQKNNMSTSELAKTLGVKNTTMIERLKQPSMTILKARDTLEPLGYEVVFHKKDTPIGDEDYIVDGDEVTVFTVDSVTGKKKKVTANDGKKEEN